MSRSEDTDCVCEQLDRLLTRMHTVGLVALVIWLLGLAGLVYFALRFLRAIDLSDLG